MKRYLHNKSFYHLCTSRMGLLQPVGAFEVLAGDTVQVQNMGLIRVSPPQTPVMHPVTVKFYNFFVPNRILDPVDRSFEWEKFITGGEDGNYLVGPPRVNGVNVEKGDVMEAFGIPPGLSRGYNSFVAKAYAKIWNEFFRDQQLQAEIDIDTYDGAVPPKKVAWERDYFTSCRPDDLLGPEVTLPLGAQAPVGMLSPANTGDNVGVWRFGGDEVRSQDSDLQTVQMGSTVLGDSEGLVADLSAAGAININDLREAFALQRYQEARNIYGSRFTEYLRYLGISSSDARLQRPELISSGKSTINFSEVLQTSQTDTQGPGTPLGHLGGHGIAGVRSRRARYFCEEHGHVISLMSVRPKAIYTTGKHRMFDRFTKEDYWQKELQAIGMEEVTNQELEADHAQLQGTFGFNNRYESFKGVPSYVSGDFRDTLDSWHLGRKKDDLGVDPSLDNDFIECNPSDRIYADTDPENAKLWCTIRNRVAVRSMLRKSTTNYIF